MISFRKFILESDYPVICSWQKGHGAPTMTPAVFLSADGRVAEVDGVAMAMSFLYVVPGTKGGIGIVEFTTTNPEGSLRQRHGAAKELYAHIEAEAWLQGCGSLLSFVAPGQGEQHIFDKTGWNDLTGGIPHMIYGKVRPCP